MNLAKTVQLFTLVFALPSLTYAQATQTNIQSLVDNAIANYQKTELSHWSFQVKRYENEEGDITSSIEEFTPHTNINDGWVLLQQNGKSPTQKQQKAFKQKKNKKDDSLNVKLSDLIDTDSLSLTDDGPSYLKANFNVWIEKLGEDAKGKLQGSLSYNKQHQFIEEITITNTATFSPLFSAKISDLKIVFHFIYDKGFVLPKKQTLNMKGSFAFFTEIDETSTDTFIYQHYHPVLKEGE